MIRQQSNQRTAGRGDVAVIQGVTAVRVMLLTIVVCCCGCTDQNAGLVSDMHEDHEHDHKHQHNEYDDHEHDHSDGFHGSHSHTHSHGHRHSDPLYGGRLVSIGHTHHSNGATHFHAEVMPIEGNTIRLHILTDAAEGGLEACPVASKEMTVLISALGEESASAEAPLVPAGQDADASEFTVVIPEMLAAAAKFSVVVPRIEIGGHRQNFSFRVHREAGTNDAGPATKEMDNSDG